MSPRLTFDLSDETVAIGADSFGVFRVWLLVFVPELDGEAPGGRGQVLDGEEDGVGKADGEKFVGEVGEALASRRVERASDGQIDYGAWVVLAELYLEDVVESGFDREADHVIADVFGGGKSARV